MAVMCVCESDVEQHGVGDSYEFIMFIVHFLFVLELLFLSCIAEPGDDDPRSTKSVHVFDLVTLYSPEGVANVFSLALFQWASPLLVRAYKRTLTSEGRASCLFPVYSVDLWPLNESETAVYTSSSFARQWAIQSRKKNPSLGNAFYRSFGFSFTIAAFLKAGSDVLGFVKFVSTLSCRVTFSALWCLTIS